MKVGIAQLNVTVGDFYGNCERIVAASRQLERDGAELVVCPELSLCGYPPMDLVDHESFVQQNLAGIDRLTHELPGEVPVLVGYVDRSHSDRGKGLQNVIGVVHNGALVFRQAKRLLPTYDVFDEARYFQPDDASRVWEYRGMRIGIAICEDLWWEIEPVPGTRYSIDPIQDLAAAGAQYIVAPSASPFHSGKPALREHLAAIVGDKFGLPVVYANLIGGNDNLIFDGRSFATDSSGAVTQRCDGFASVTATVDVQPATARVAAGSNPTPDHNANRRSGATTSAAAESIADIAAALRLGIRDYLAKTGFSRAHLGLSGGIDSAVVTVLAAQALGPQNLHAFLLPSQYSSPGSISDSEVLCRRLGVAWSTVAIGELFTQFTQALAPVFGDVPADTTEENVQARIRGVLLMAYSNKTGSLTLTTGNKSELAVGYCTLYGDMVGGLSVIGDVLKTEVYQLASYLNREREIIPRAILEKPPSAELRPDQRDDDSLPPYEVLDRILQRYVVHNATYAQIVADGFDTQTVRHILDLVAKNEYKRRQAAPVLKISPRAFGTGRRMPIARQVYETHF